MPVKATRQSDLLTFINNIPGGARRCLNDDRFTILEVNEGFLELFGFSANEIEEKFNDSYLNMIYPADRKYAKDSISKQLSDGELVEIEYRVVCKDGSVKWVLDKGQLVNDGQGRNMLYCIIMDITGNRSTREELRLSLERHEIILDQATDIIFEWNIDGDTLVLSPNWEKKFGYKPPATSIEDKLPICKNIHPDDVRLMLELLENSRKGVAYSKAEVRIKNADGRYIWCRVRVTDQFGEDGAPIKAVGVITDIDEEKQMIENLRMRAERDMLTGLYNKSETQTLIEKHLENCPRNDLGALLMIDIDNFKVVNDTQGHLLGDAVLSEISTTIKKQTRSSDIIGRIGGDEFAVFLKAIPSSNFAFRKADEILQGLKVMSAGEKRSFQVTCSVGLSMFPAHGLDFQSLYKCADIALYEAKSRGKCCVAMFDPVTMAEGEIKYSSLGAQIDSDKQSSSVRFDIVNYVFEILYGTDDIEEAVALILEIVGKRFDVSRAYVFESSEDGRFTSNTFEWCNAGVMPQKDNLQNLEYSELDDYDSLFSDDGIFYCRDVSKLPSVLTDVLNPQGIKSMLQCAIRENGCFGGFVGFDECTGMRFWSKDEIYVLSIVAKLLSTFLLKYRAQLRDRMASDRMREILDAQDAFIYAVDSENYELLYLNKKTRALDPCVTLGMCCHRAFYDNGSPCDHCPIAEMKRGGEGSGEFYNPQYGVWTKAHAAPLKWGERDAYLIACYDITQYKAHFNDEEHSGSQGNADVSR